MTNTKQLQQAFRTQQLCENCYLCEKQIWEILLNLVLHVYSAFKKGGSHLQKKYKFNLKNVFSEESPKYCTASWLRCWIKSQEASDSACFRSHFLRHKQTGILLFKHTLGNKAFWKWSEPRARSSQGVKSTVTARILRFVILPVTAL